MTARAQRTVDEASMPPEAHPATTPPRTPVEARHAGLVALTTPDRPSAKLETVAGLVLWMDWCRGEAERVRQSGRQAAIVKDSDGRVAVWVSPSPHLKPEPPRAE